MGDLVLFAWFVGGLLAAVSVAVVVLVYMVPAWRRRWVLKSAGVVVAMGIYLGVGAWVMSIVPYSGPGWQTILWPWIALNVTVGQG